MNTAQLLNEIKAWPLGEKIRLIELISKQIREAVLQPTIHEDGMQEAASLLLQDYEQDQELTAFTELDGEDVDETK
jgi:hypothetical protein